MSFDGPKLDDSNAKTLLAAARSRLIEIGSTWQASDAADPGVAMLEAVAQVTGEELIRLNRLPDVMQTRFMTMLGATLRPGMAETATLRFALASESKEPIVIKAGHRVASSRSPDAIYTLLDDVRFEPGTVLEEATAARVERIARQIVGVGSGTPAQRVDLPHVHLPGAPASVSQIDVLVRWALVPKWAEIVEISGHSYVRYREVEQMELNETNACFMVDRVSGQVTFGGNSQFFPPEGASIVVSYFATSGTSDVSSAMHNRPPGPGELTESLDPLPGISITNPATAIAGIPAETAQQRLSRGAISLFAGDMVFRARDYEALALQSHPGVARAHALTAAEHWTFAQPGKVRLLIAPKVASSVHGTTKRETLEAAVDQAQFGQECLDAVSERLNANCPLGVQVEVDWLKVKAVGVSCRIYVSHGVDKPSVEAAIQQTLGELLSPLPGPIWPEGWPLGRQLRQSEVLETLLAVTEVRAVDRVRLEPKYPMLGQVTMIAADPGQRGVWFTAMGGRLYRTMNAGLGWNNIAFEEHQIMAVATHPVHSGLLAVATQNGSIFVSRNCGRSFDSFAEAPYTAELLSWADGSETPRLLLGGAGDLAETVGPMGDGRVPKTQPLFAQDGIIGPAHAIATVSDRRGGRLVVVARRALAGVLLSSDSGWDGGYLPIGLTGHDVRALAFLTDAETIWLIAGCAHPVIREHHAVYIAQIDPDRGEIDQWIPMDSNWPGGGVNSLAVSRQQVYAGTRSNGLIFGSFANGRIDWTLPDENSGLPTTIDGRAPAGITAVTSAPMQVDDGDFPGRIMLGGNNHLFLSGESDQQFSSVADRPGADSISIPADWVLCGDHHRIEVLHVTE